MLNIGTLKVGDEVECVSSFHVEIKEKDLLEVTGVNERSIVFMSIKNGNKYTFNKSYMDCFKKIEKYTFDDLIDVAVQAVKDKVINGANIRLHEIGFMHNKTHYKLMPAFDCKEQIDLIKSIYKETFVIEYEDDVKKIKDDCIKITLANGEIMPKKVFRKLIHDFTFYIVFKVLKGATVEQSKC